MKRIKNWVNGLSIKKKIIYYSYLAIIPIMLLICSLYVQYNYEKVKKERFETNQSSIQSLAASIGLVMTDVKDIANYIEINQQILEILTEDETDQLNQDTKLWTQRAPMQMVEDMMALKGYIKTVAIYPENGVNPYLRCIDFSSYVPTLEQIRQTDSYIDAIEKQGGDTWKFVEKGETEMYLATRTEKLVLYREIYDLAKSRPLAYLVLGISADHIVKLCENAIQNSKEGIIVYNRAGEELIRVGTINPEADSNEIYTYQASKTSPIICKMTPKIRMIDMINEIFYMPVGLLVGVLLGLFPVLILVSNIVSNPLQKVCEAMGKFRKGDFSQQVEVETGDEVGEVALCFNKMVTDIKTLIDRNYIMALKEKESELAALQAQINPHFLYNTLDALYWQACNAGNEEIAENIYALSQLFRLVLGQGEGIVTVDAEMELVGRYLEIQKMKFGRKLDYTICVEPELGDKLIPKLILQPFAENAVIHGLGNSTENCQITVTGKLTDGKAEFRIKDTGIGMTREQLESIWEQQTGERKSGQRIGGYAIYNVHERLELKYNGDFKLEVRSIQGEGTEILMVIPLEETKGV